MLTNLLLLQHSRQPHPLSQAKFGDAFTKCLAQRTVTNYVTGKIMPTRSQDTAGVYEIAKSLDCVESADGQYPTGVSSPRSKNIIVQSNTAMHHLYSFLTDTVEMLPEIMLVELRDRHTKGRLA